MKHKIAAIVVALSLPLLAQVLLGTPWTQLSGGGSTVNTRTGLQVTTAAPVGLSVPLIWGVGSKNPSSCDLKLGPIGFYSPLTKHPYLFEFGYNSGDGASALGRGWDLGLPYILETAQGFKYFDGVAFNKLSAATAASEFYDRFGRRLKRNTDSSFTLLEDDGGRVNFGVADQISTQQVRWLPNSKSYKGWTDYYDYITENGRKYLDLVTLNGHTPSGVASSHKIKFLYSAGVVYPKVLTELRTVVGASAIARLEFGYSSNAQGDELLRTITRKINGAIDEIYDFGYYTQGTNAGQLYSVQTLSNALVTYQYEAKPISGDVNGNKAVLSQATYNTGTQNIVRRFNCETGTFSNNEAVYEKITTTEPDASKVVGYYNNGAAHINLRGLQFKREKVGVGNNIIAVIFNKLERGGLNSDLVASTLTVLKDNGAVPSAPKYYAVGSTVNFNEGKSLRTELLINYGRLFGYNESTESISDDPADTTRTEFGYTDTPAVGAFNQVSLLKELGPNNARTKETQLQYDASGNPDIVLVWNDESSSFNQTALDVDSFGNLRDVYAGSRHTHYTYDRFMLRTIEPGLGHITTIYRNPTNLELERVVDPAGTETIYGYDTLRRVNSIIKRNGALSKTVYTLDDFQQGGVNTTKTTVNGRSVRRYYDNFWNTRQTRSPHDLSQNEFFVKNYNYTPSTSFVSKSYVDQGEGDHALNAFGVTSSYVDSYLRSVAPSTSGNGAGPWSYTPTSNGSTVADPVGDLFNITFTTNVTNYTSGNATEATTVRKEWDPNSLTVSYKDLANNAFRFDYSSLSQIDTVRGPTGVTLKNFQYDGTGFLSTATNAQNQTITYQYDTLGRLINESVNGSSITYHYDTPTETGLVVRKGELAGVGNQYGFASFGYDSLGRLTNLVEEIYGTGLKKFFTFVRDANGKLQQVVYPNGATINYSYDDRQLIRQISSPEAPAQFIGGVLLLITGRTASGQVADLATGLGTTGFAQYYSNTLIKNFVAKNAAGETTNSWDYDYFNDGTLKSLKYSPAGQSPTDDLYDYDTRGLVDGISRNGTLFDINHDNLGRTTKDDTKGYSNITYGNSANPYGPSNVTTSAGSLALSYYPTNLTQSFGGITYTYNAWGRLIRVQSSAAITDFYPGPLGNYSKAVVTHIPGGAQDTYYNFGAGLYRIETVNGSTMAYAYGLIGDAAIAVPPDYDPGAFGVELIWPLTSPMAQYDWGTVKSEESGEKKNSDSESGSYPAKVGGDTGPTASTPVPREHHETPTPSPSPSPSPSAGTGTSPGPATGGTSVSVGPGTTDQSGSTSSGGTGGGGTQPVTPGNCESNKLGGRTLGNTYVKDPCDDPCNPLPYTTTGTISPYTYPWYWPEWAEDTYQFFAGYPDYTATAKKDMTSFEDVVVNVTGAKFAQETICDFIDNGVTLENTGDLAFGVATAWGAGKVIGITGGWLARTPAGEWIIIRVKRLIPKVATPNQGRRLCETVAPVSDIAPGEPFLVSIERVGFGQSTVRETFANGHTIQELAEALATGAVKPRSLPPIMLAESEGALVAIDGNRRLASYLLAGQTQVWAQCASAKRIASQLWKLSNTIDGHGATVVNELGEHLYGIINPSFPGGL